MKTIREAEYKACDGCGRRDLVRDEAFGCQRCEKVIDLALTPSQQHAYLEMTVFTHGRDYTTMRFCSWACVIAELRDRPCDYFVSLPTLHFDRPDEPGLRADDFFALLAPASAPDGRRA